MLNETQQDYYLELQRQAWDAALAWQPPTAKCCGDCYFYSVFDTRRPVVAVCRESWREIDKDRGACPRFTKEV
jgi:hypothetical protein